MQTAYDEMYAADGSVRESYRTYAEWLQATPAEVVARKREEAARLMAEAEAEERMHASCKSDVD